MKKKVAIFGAWQEGINLFFNISNQVEVVAFLDNNLNLQSKEIYGIKIIAPYDLEKIEYDEIYISSSKRYRQMLVQLLELNVKKEKIKTVFEINKIRKDLNMTKYYLRNQLDIYEEKWAELRKKYDRVMLYMLDLSSIGEAVTRIWKMIEDEAITDKGILRIFIPTIGNKKRVCNKELLKLVKGRMHIAENDFEFWEYIIDLHSAELEIIDYNKYLYRDGISNRIIKQEQIYFKFRKSQIELGKEKLAQMGIKGEYICLSARTSDYNRNTLSNNVQIIDNHEFRNSDFYDYKETIDYLESLNLQTVRMGRGEGPITPIGNCVDYAGLYADDFMDFFLMANCKFAIVGGGTGIFALATTFGRPVLFVNFIPISFGSGGEVYAENDLYIPKKVFDNRENRCLSLMEIADVEQECLIYGGKYKEKGIEFIDNTAEEILEAVKELMARLDKTWQDTEDDIILYQRYLSIFSIIDKKSKSNINNWIGGAMPRRLSMNYLRKNRYLCDMES